PNGVSIALYLSQPDNRKWFIEHVLQDMKIPTENKEHLLQDLEIWCNNSSVARTKFAEKRLRPKSGVIAEAAIVVEEHKEIKSQPSLNKASSTGLTKKPHVKFLNSN